MTREVLERLRRREVVKAARDLEGELWLAIFLARTNTRSRGRSPLFANARWIERAVLRLRDRINEARS